jgi:hypothetical protein
MPRIGSRPPMRARILQQAAQTRAPATLRYLPGLLMVRFSRMTSCAEVRGRNRILRCRWIEVPRLVTGVLVRSGDQKKRADWKRAEPTQRWLHRSSNGSDSSCRYWQVETRSRTIRAGAALSPPWHDGMASPAALHAGTSTGACSAWPPAGQHKASPAARRPGRA